MIVLSLEDARGKDMMWTNRYWDAIDLVYWSPRYIGLKSIPRRCWTINADTISVPRSKTNESGPLYSRQRFGSEYWEYVRRQEEMFNPIFDLVFAILPGDVVAEIFGRFTYGGSEHPYESLGTELRSRYGWGENDNTTTPDGFFVAQDSILAVELKFNAKTSLDQFAKYVVLIAAEEVFSGMRDNLDLLYVFNSDPESTFEKQIGFPSDSISECGFEHIEAYVKNRQLKQFLIGNEAAVRGTFERLNVTCINWKELSSGLAAYAEQLTDERGDRTIRRLLEGVIEEIAQHPLSNVDDEP